jgi:hypothetical protein
MNKYFYPSISAPKCTKLLSLLLLTATLQANAQFKKINVLFLGNSFTAVNNLPDVLTQAAKSVGDTVIADANVPGGYTLEDHTLSATSTGKIALGNWNYVVLQEQSQKPAFPDAQVAVEVYPFAHQLDSLVHLNNKCGRSVFYETWGYKEGDPSNCPTFPPICTYVGMDSLLTLRYNQMAKDNKALLAPVGEVFKELRLKYPTINLYDIDGKHPSEAGTYAAAVTFYTILFGKNPMAISYDFVLPAPDAVIIRQVVMNKVYNLLPTYYVGKYNPKAVFTNSITGSSVSFNASTSTNAVNYSWDFADGGSSTTMNPVHSYTASGTYNVRLIVDNCLLRDTTYRAINVTGTGIQEMNSLSSVVIAPNPTSTSFHLQSNNQALGNLHLTLCNLLGQAIMQVSHYEGQLISIEALPKGVYLLHLQDAVSGATHVQRLIKE